MYTVLREDGNYLNNGQGTYNEYIVDNIEDVATLPTGKDNKSINRPRPGSTALVANAGMVYVLNNAREWVVLVEG
ncbi:MAG: hypothetical protein IJW04_00915 [Ruminococcus sp.]|nr:hypothetical protein [Ruminococcus sp.]